jgi:predicted TIM-barrel fold metal-dependent hydrolase
MFRRSVWINPFWEDDVDTVVELMGAERVLFGSDWPHIEGMPQPLDYLPELNKLTDEQRRAVLFDNASELVAPPAS